jgi:hypothetical protein
MGAPKPGSPLLRVMRVVLSNGASLRMPTVSSRSTPFVATFVSARRGEDVGARGASIAAVPICRTADVTA